MASGGMASGGMTSGGMAHRSGHSRVRAASPQVSGPPPAPVTVHTFLLEISPNASLRFLSQADALSVEDSPPTPQDLALNVSQRGSTWWETWRRKEHSEQMFHSHWLSYEPLPYGFHVCVGMVMLLTAVGALVGNGLVLWSIVSFRSLRTSSNLFIISLALADIMMTVVDLPLFAASSFLGYWPFGYHVCQLYGATTGTAGLVTINTLAAISFDRYTVVVRRVRPIHHISKAINLLVIVVIWLVSVLWAACPLLGWSHYTLEGIGTTCTFDYLTRTARNTSFVVMLMVFNFGLPLMLIVFSYSRIFQAVASVRRGLMDCSPHISVGSHRQQVRGQTELRTATTILVIIAFFCIAWTPYVIVALLGLFGDVSVVTPTVSALPCILAKVATVSNPPLYSIGHPKFRKKIRYLFKLTCRGTRWPGGAGGPSSSPPTTQDNNMVAPPSPSGFLL